MQYHHKKSCLYVGSVFHARVHPKKHSFKYNVFCLNINLSELNEINKKFKLLSVNKFNIVSVYEKDYGPQNGKSLNVWVKELLSKNGVNQQLKNIFLLTYPRIFGYVFNPLSILYCYDENKLISIFYEVKNTSNEQHTYIFTKGEHTKENTLKHECNKDFYVSPFIGMSGKYVFRNKLTKNHINIIIELYDNNNNKVLMASQSGKFIDFKESKLLKYNLLNPLFGFKVMSAILFESIKIVLKGGKYYARNKKPKDTISFEGSF